MPRVKGDGGPAFPRSGASGLTIEGLSTTVSSHPFDGMTLRDYFAAKAMQGWFSNGHRDGTSYSVVATNCYKAADAMLEAREEKRDA